MATYLQGVTDYIPDYQPFQPDYNFYNNVLQAKQTQYDTNWKALNNVYSTLYNANLTRADNIAKKEDLLKQIDFNVKRVAGLDLSLEQNVNQAMQVFKPFYQDQYLMKDMAWTKNFINRYNSAQNLLNSQDEKQRAQYWDTGLKEMMYRREEFKNAAYEDTLNFSDVTYTPYVNSIEKYLKTAKELGLSVDISTPPTGNSPYTVRQKNGELLLPALQELFAATYANDPALQRVYATQAYVNRQDYIQQNLATFNNDRLAAERDYLSKQYSTLQEQVRNFRDVSADNAQTTENKLSSVSKDYDSGNINFSSKDYLIMLQEGYETQKVIEEHADKLNNEINGSSSTVVTRGSQEGLDLNNLELARLKVDAVYANMLAQEDILSASNIYANKDRVIEYKVDPYYLEKVKDSNARERIKLAADLKTKKAVETKGIEDGIYEIDYETGDIKRDELGKPILAPEYKPNGAPKDQEISATDPQNLILLNEKFRTDQRSLLLGGYLKDINSLISQATMGPEPVMSNEEAAYIFGGSQDLQALGPELIKRQAAPDLETAGTPVETAGYNAAKDYFARRAGVKRTANFQNFMREYEKDPIAVVTKLDETGDLFQIQERFNQWLSKNKGLSFVNDIYTENKNFLVNNSKVYSYAIVRALNNQIDKENETFLVKELNKEVETIINQVGISDPFSGGLIPPTERIKENPARAREEWLLDKIGREAYFKLTPEQRISKFNELRNNIISKDVIEKISSFYVNNPNVSKEEFVNKYKSQVYRNLALSEGGTIVDTPYGEAILVPRNRQEKLEYDSENLLENVHEKLSKIYNEKVTSPQIKSYVGFKTEMGPDGKLGLAVPANGDTVNLKHNVPGNKAFFGLISDINNTVWNQPGYKVTFGQGEDGELYPVSSKSAKDLTPDQKNRIIGMLNDIAMKRGSKSDINPFYIYSMDIGDETADKATMKVKLPLEVLNKYLLKTKEGEATGVGYFTADELNAMASQGIGFVAPKNTWSNDLFQRNQTTPWEGIFNANEGRTFEYTDPNGGGTLSIRKLKDGQGFGDYLISASAKSYLPDGSITVAQPMHDYYLPKGKNIDELITQTQRELMALSKVNIQMLQDFQRQGNEQAVLNGQKAFKVTGPLFQFK